MIQHLERPKNHFTKAISLVLIADLFSAMQAVFVKMALPMISVTSLVFIRCFVNLLIIYGYVIVTEGKRGVFTLYQTKAWKHQLVRSITGVGAIYCFYYGLFYMPIGPATLLFFTFPLFIPIISRVWLKVAVTHRQWWGLGVSFLGILCILRPDSNLFSLTALIPLLGAILGSIGIVSIRVLHYKKETPQTIMAFYFTFGVLISGLIFLLFHHIGGEIFDEYSISLAVIVGIAAALYQMFFTLSAKHAPACFLSPFIYGVFIFASLADYFIWGVSIHWGTLLGFLLIVLGTIFMIFLHPKDELKFISSPD